jgi:Peptidase propeptide and YPEB domain
MSPRHLSIFSVVSVLWAGPAYAADRPPDAAERQAIEAALKTQGFTQWGDVELDGKNWEIDDALHSDGKEYDVELQEGSLSVIKKEVD